MHCIHCVHSETSMNPMNPVNTFLLSGFACYDVRSLAVNATIFQNARVTRHRGLWVKGGNYGHQRCSDPPISVI